MKVLLVNTNRMRPPIAPIGLDYLGTALQARGHTIELLDLCAAGEGAIASAFRGAHFDAVGMSFRNTDDCYFASGASFIPSLVSDVKQVRAAYDGPIVLGGCGFSLMPADLLRYTGADYGLVGDGETSFDFLLRALGEDGSIEGVPGLVYRKAHKWRHNAGAWAPLDGIDLSSRDVVDNAWYYCLGGQIGIETKRGCPGCCVYCADPVVKGAVPRLRPPRDIVSEIRNLLAQGIDTFHLCDSEFNIPAKHAEAVCREIVECGLGHRVHWYAYCSPSPFSDDLAAAMVRAGCVGIDFGADSGSDMQLRRLGRDFATGQLRETASICRRHGIVFMYDLLLGAPGETGETLTETVTLMKDISPDRVGVSLGVRIYPGTPLAKEAERGALDEKGLYGGVAGLEPVYYVSPLLGERPFELLAELIGDDERFFMPSTGDGQDYNYNDNAVLQKAITEGYRGAYWDILRRLGRGP